MELRSGFACAATAALLSWAAGCGTPPAGSSPQAAASASTATPGAAPLAKKVLPDRARRVAIGEPLPVELPITLEPFAAGDDLLIVAQSLERATSHLRRRDAKSGELGPLVSLRGERVIGAFEEPAGTMLLATSRGGDRAREVCVLRVEGAEVTRLACHRAAPVSVVSTPKGLAFVWVEPPEPEEDKDPGAKPPKAPASPRSSDAAAPPPAPPPPPPSSSKPSEKPKKKKKREPLPPLEVVLQRLDASAALDGELVRTGLIFEPPLTGMNLVAAHGRGEDIDLLWYETAKLVKGKPEPPMGRAALATGVVRSDGKLYEATRVAFVEGDLEYGDIATHREPRFLLSPRGSVYVGAQWLRGACEARRVTPRLLPTVGMSDVCAIDPLRVAESRGIETEEVDRFKALRERKPRRAPLQPPVDVGLVAWSGDRGFFFEGEKLVSIARDGSGERVEPPPIPARRTLIEAGHFARSGESVAVGPGAVHRFDADGKAISGAAPNADATAPAPPSWSSAPARVAHVGDAWWVTGPHGYAALGPASLRDRIRAVPADGSVLVGDAAPAGSRDAAAMWIELTGGAMRVSVLGPAGDEAARGDTQAAVRPGFAATRRAAGGALVAGVSTTDPTRIVALTVTADGKAAAPRPTSLRVDAGVLRVRLAPLPAGGALLFDEGRRAVVWLDDDGNEKAHAAWSGTSSETDCAVGWSGRDRFPSAQPGAWVDVHELALDGACVLGEPQWFADGSLRWFTTRESGADILAELAIVPASVLAATDASQAAGAPAGWDPLESTCRHASLSIL